MEDVDAICSYLVKKPTGASIGEAKKVVDAKLLDFRKVAAYKFWGLLTEVDGKLRITERGRSVVKGGAARTDALISSVAESTPYTAIAERAAHKREESITATEVAAHWHEHFSDETSANDQILNDQAVCFFQLAQGAGLGQVTIGRKGQSTRFTFARENLESFVSGAEGTQQTSEKAAKDKDDLEAEEGDSKSELAIKSEMELGQGIFIAHGKNKKPLEQLRRILDQFKVPYKVATEEPNLGRPIGAKVKQVMEACNCAILLFTADEELFDKDGNSVWRPNENVIHELGASGYLYGNRIVILKEKKSVWLQTTKTLVTSRLTQMLLMPRAWMLSRN